MYLFPTLKRDYDAHVILLVVPDAPGDDFETTVYEAVRKWVTDTWPFDRVGYPGREMSGETWRALPEPSA